ncbi:hypothetical protein BX264_5695 [Streptomyces sp. 2333.5]|nr:hypothetical protein BX264_5695 [Streptomyces sp. 2333.5]SEE71399.1 hypothetical protein SAMN05428943_5797 [Streptomyces sp. 2314.4]SEE96373.1 hypothetical protein SAMN05428942_5793 [Streptomyces sp. 2112.2]
MAKGLGSAGQTQVPAGRALNLACGDEGRGVGLGGRAAGVLPGREPVPQSGKRRGVGGVGEDPTVLLDDGGRLVCSYLTGMRLEEVLGLRSGRCPEPEGGGRHLIYGHVYKTARDEDGNHLSQGEVRDVPWVAIPPVVAAASTISSTSKPPARPRTPWPR